MNAARLVYIQKKISHLDDKKRNPQHMPLVHSFLITKICILSTDELLLLD